MPDAKTMPDAKIYYICDPDKNVNCSRKNCKLKPLIPGMPGPCDSTTHPEFAKEPIKAFRFVVPMSSDDFREFIKGTKYERSKRCKKLK